MKFLIPAAAALLLATLASVALAAEPKTLLTCHISGGGNVSIQATAAKDKVDLLMDKDAREQLKGVGEARDLGITLESADSGSTAGPIDLLEAGRGYFGGEGDCGLGLEFNVKNQRLGADRDVALKPSHGYNKVECKGVSREIESCALGEELKDVASLKDYLAIEVAD